MIEIDSIDVTYDGNRVIEGLSLTVREGEFFTLLGPSGCGKTTLLRSVSGFVDPSAGTIRVDGRDVTRLPPEDRGIGVVFQNYALFPHLNVFDNVAFGPRTAGRPRAEVRRAVTEALERIGIAEHAGKKPAELSGGQQQRVAIARALILGTRTLLFDEPLSNLDAKLREVMRDEIRQIQTRLGLTVIYVTHDQQEALAISDRIAVMERGRVRQIGSPRALYSAPENAFVCTFMGETSCLPPTCGLPGLENGAAAYVRPEHLTLDVDGGPGVIRIDAEIERVVFQGARQRVVCRTGHGFVTAEVPADAPLGEEGAPITLSARQSDIHIFPASTA